jgi:hypothetical protein
MSNSNPFWDPFGVFTVDNSSTQKAPEVIPKEQKSNQSSLRAETVQPLSEISSTQSENKVPVPQRVSETRSNPEVVTPEARRSKIRELRKVLRKFEKEAKRDNRLSKPGVPSK